MTARRSAIAAALKVALAGALPLLALAACSDRQEASAPDDSRQIQVAPAKPPTPPPETPAPTVARTKPPAATNTIAATRDEPLPPDAQVQEDAAAVGMTSRTTTSTTTTTERSSSMSNLY